MLGSADIRAAYGRVQEDNLILMSDQLDHYREKETLLS